MSLVVLFYYFHIWSNRHFNYILIALRCGMLSIGSVISGIFSALLFWEYMWFILLASSCIRLLKILYPLWCLLLIRLSAGNLSCLPKGGTVAQVCVFLFLTYFGLFFWYSNLPDLLLLYHSGMSTRSQNQSGGRCEFSIWAVGCVRGPSGVVLSWVSLKNLWVNFLIKS